MPKRQNSSTLPSSRGKAKVTKTSTPATAPTDYDLLAAAILKQSNSTLLLGQSTDASSGSPMTPATGSTPQTDISYHESMRTQQPAQASQCTSTDPQPTSSSPNNIDNILSAVFQSGEPAVPKSNVCLLDGIPLGAAVPIKTKGKIWEDKYIDLSSLLQRQRGNPCLLI